MDFIIVFFRDVLSGPLYITVVIINSILICSCIGYLGENYLNRKKAQAKYNNTYTTVSNVNTTTNASNVNAVPVNMNTVVNTIPNTAVNSQVPQDNLVNQQVQSPTNINNQM